MRAAIDRVMRAPSYQRMPDTSRATLLTKAITAARNRAADDFRRESARESTVSQIPLHF
jgi:hypothetical protein